MKPHRFRILDADFKINHVGNSWKSLDECKSLVNYSKGEMIYEYSECLMHRLWEVL